MSTAVLFLVWTLDTDTTPAPRTQLTTTLWEDHLTTDIEQHTCALEVVLAVRGKPPLPVSEGTPLQMDVPPSGALACLPPPTDR